MAKEPPIPDVVPTAYVLHHTIKDLIAGTVGGWAQVVVGHPFDTLKVRLQTQGSNPKYKNAWDCLTLTVKEEGPSALYKGVTSPLLGVGICNAVLFAANGALRRLIGGDRKELTIGEYTAAGALSGIAIAWVNCPVELLKIKLQTQYGTSGRGQLYTGVIDCGIKVHRKSGIAGLYRGIGITLIREIPSFAAYFGVYEGVKKLFHARHPNRELGAGELIMAGGLAGIAAWIPCYPQDVIKSRIQSDTRNLPIKHYIKEILHQSNGSLRGFFRGFGPTMLRAFPANAATFLAYETARKAMD